MVPRMRRFEFILLKPSFFRIAGIAWTIFRGILRSAVNYSGVGMFVLTSSKQTQTHTPQYHFMKTLLAILPAVALMAVGSIAHAGPAYPLTTCVVSGEKLDDMGKPVIINYKGTEVRFCCNHCVSKFNTDPAKYLAKLKAAQAAK